MALMTKLGASPLKKEEFVGAKTARVLPTPRQGRVKKGDDAGAYAVNIMLYGPVGSGKSLTVADLIAMGLKVFVVVTDIGANGVISIKLNLKGRGLADRLSTHLRWVHLEDSKDIEDFLEEPAAFDPEIYKWGPDVIFWDGFGYAQQTSFMEKAGEMITEQNDINEGRKGVSELREQGYKFELADYQVLRNYTVRQVKNFCSLHNKETGQVWHKIFTCQETLKSKGADKGGGFTESNQPLLTGAGGVLTCGAFDLIIRTTKDPFKYVISGNKDSATKNRGFSLPADMDASFQKVWETIEKDLDIVRGAVNPDNIAPILVQGNGEDEG